MSYSAGQDVDAWCSRCKAVFRHVIHAVVDGKPVRVECKTCRATHRFRATPPGTPTPRTPRSSKPKKRAADRSLLEYERLLKGRDLEQAIVYRITERYCEDQVITHSKFGIGVVTRILPDRKIEARFRDGPKTLVHSR